MSSRSKRSSTATPQPQVGGTTTPLLSGRPSSPLSPTRHSRLQEKAELQNLNDRLACYIDRVRNLETENARLTIEVQTTRDTVTRETTNIKSIYETELGEARRLIDETAREKAKLEIDVKRVYQENEELRAKLEKKIKDLNLAEGNARMYEARAADLGNKYSAANNDRKKALDDLNDLEKEFDRLSKQLEETRKNLEIETLARVELENTIQSLREELTFKDTIHLQEVNETRSRRQVEISEIDGRLTEQYEAMLKLSLQELRDQYENQMRSNREEVELLYEQKIKNLQNSANRNASVASNAVEELRTCRTRIETLNGRIDELENTNSSLNARIRDLEQLMDADRARYNQEIHNLEDELQRLREEMAQQLQEYQDLMDIKVSLDLEIAAYDKLLCGEETRLNITPSTAKGDSSIQLSQSMKTGRSTPLRKTPSRGPSQGPGALKRKRVYEDLEEDMSRAEFYETNNAKGDIVISELDPEGKFVKIHNKGSKDLAVGGWIINRTTESDVVTFKFHHNIKLASQATIAVWSSDAGATHEPPNNIVMKSHKWILGDKIKTVLITNEGEEVAGAERVKRTITKATSRRSIGATRRTAVDSTNGEDLYHHQGDPQSQEKCVLM